MAFVGKLMSCELSATTYITADAGSNVAARLSGLTMPHITGRTRFMEIWVYYYNTSTAPFPEIGVCADHADSLLNLVTQCTWATPYTAGLCTVPFADLSYPPICLIRGSVLLADLPASSDRGPPGVRQRQESIAIRNHATADGLLGMLVV